MDEQQQFQREVDETITKGRALVREVRQTLERSRHLFADLGIDPEKEHERLKADGGDEAIAHAQEEYRSFIEEIEAEVKRNLMHSQVRVGTQVRFRPNKV